MAINYTYETNNQVIVQKVTLGDDSEYDNYLVGVHGKIIATDDEDNATTSRPAIFSTTDPAEIASADDLTSFADLTMPDSVTASADALVADETIRAQMAEDIVKGRNYPQSAIAPWG
jgi:hypothetical protein